MTQSLDMAEAREALEYWSRREATLPWRRRAARREAREMAARWRARILEARLERWRLTRFAPLFDTRGRSAAAHVRRLTWLSMRRTVVGRWIVGALAGVALFTTASFLLFALVVAQILGF